MENLELRVAIGSSEYYSIKTEIEVPEINKFYYLPTEYKEPIKCKLIDYIPTQSIRGAIRVLATVIVNDKLQDVSPNLLFKSKGKASEYYLKHKNEMNWNYLFD